MAAPWVLVAWIVQIWRELRAIAPQRDTTSDGTIGDQAHQDSRSGHNPDETGNAERRDADTINEVRAVDIDADLNVPGLTMRMLVAYLVGRCRAGLERRLIYIIYDGVIWAASSGWVARRYTGSNPHDRHAHLSGHPDYDDDGSPFGLAALMEGTDMPLTPDDLDQIRTQVALGVYDVLWVAANGKPYRGLTYSGPGSVGAAVKANLAALTAAPVLAGLAGRDLVDEQQIAADLAPPLLANLTPDRIAAAIPPELAAQVADVLAARLARTGS